jgi:tRNA(fMet)-specific endonuclease VapC
VGSLLDTSVLIGFERGGSLPAVPDDDDTGISAVTASELLHGVHRARTAAQRVRREAFVTTVLSVIPVLPFDLDTARLHARIWADLAGSGNAPGSHDLMIAATALVRGWSVVTGNVPDFARIPGLLVTGYGGG